MRNFRLVKTLSWLTVYYNKIFNRLFADCCCGCLSVLIWLRYSSFTLEGDIERGQEIGRKGEREREREYPLWGLILERNFFRSVFWTSWKSATLWRRTVGKTEDIGKAPRIERISMQCQRLARACPRLRPLSLFHSSLLFPLLSSLCVWYNVM